MSTNLEIRIVQRDRLFDLLTLRELNRGSTVNRLEEMIISAEVSMDEEDVAWVEKKIAKLFPRSEE